MLSRILVATDASEASDRVVDCVGHLRAIGSRDAVLLHVLNVRDVGGLSLTLRRAILPKLEAQQQTLIAAGFHTELDIPLGIPFHEINRLVTEHSSAVIVAGSHGESLLKEMWLGSTASSILDNARVPVLLVRIEITADTGRLERMRDRLLACGARSVDLDLPYGSPISIVLGRAKGPEPALVVMGTQGRGFIREIFLGSVAHDMARYAPLPVLFVPPQRGGPGSRTVERVE